ncbi:MAG TPA: PAS domain S-box protein, partial [Arenibaculum sp.]|nr:PAS domain S-box protein [Arenibaculum sp.]
RRLGDIAANFPGVIYRRVLHRDGTVSYPYVSEGVADLVGATPGDRSPLTLDDMARLIAAPEDSGSWKDAVLQSARTLEPYRIEGRLRRVDGTLRWVRSAANPHREADGSIVWDGVVLDISDQKEVEAALRRSEAMTRAIVEAAADGIVTVDEAGRIEGFNPAAERLFGHAAPAVIGRDVRILMPERYHARYGGWSRAFPGGVPAGRTVGIDGLRKDATTFPVELSVGLALVDGRRLFAGIVRDVTERKRAEDDLHRTLAEREVLLQEVHHRVKNNLQVIIAMISLEVRRLESPDARTRVAEISQRVLAMGRVHERLYASGNLARIDFGQYLDDLARGIAELYSGLPVTLEVDVADHWWCDLDRAIPLGLIANELVVNAFKHAFPDGGAGRVRVGLRQAGGESVEIFVADDGNGNGAGVEAGTGGIGTTLVRTLVRQIEATLRVEREAGTRVTIIVPAASGNG